MFINGLGKNAKSEDFGTTFVIVVAIASKKLRDQNREDVMNENKVISLAAYKARLLFEETAAKQEAAAATLPKAGRLWELLDRNISLSIWRDGR